MIMRNRFSELAHPIRVGQWPKAEDWETHGDWGWRFVHALRELVIEGASNRFQKLAAEARHGFERDACLVIQACADYTGDGAQSAVEGLKPTRATKPADRGWLEVQRAAVLLELDMPAEAVDAAKKALVATKPLDGDLSVSAIRGAAASLLYSLAGLAAGDLQATITAQDNAGNWWRAQDVSWALQKDLKFRFEGWTSNGSVHFVTSTAADDLATAAWNAAFSGAWGSWRHLTAMNAKLSLTSAPDPVRAAAALGALIFTGDKKAAKDTARKMWLDGPPETLHPLVNVAARRPWTKRDEGPTMAVLAEAGDLLDPASADHVVQRIVELLNNEGNVRVHGQAWTFRWSEADGALRRVLKAGTAKSHKIAADLISADFATCDDSIANAHLRVANALTAAGIGIRRLNRLLQAAIERDDHYAIGLLETIASDSPPAMAQLRRHANNGNMNAVRSLLVAGSTDNDDFLAFGKSAAKTVRAMVVNARGTDGTRVISGYVNDQLDDLTLAALHTDDNKLWKEVTDALAACVIEETQQQRAVRRLASRFQSLPPHVQRKLKKLAPTLRGSSFGISIGGRPNEYAAAVALLRIAAGTVPDLEVEALLLSERRNNPVGFVGALGAWNSERKLPFLATMIVDDNPAVRGQAAFSIIEHAHHYPGDRDRAFAVISSALMQETGGALPDGLAQALAAYPAEELAALEEELRTHPSAVIRARFAQGD